MLKPILKLTAATQKVAKGDFGVVVERAEAMKSVS
jgi:nitrogen fixation/metabolism regulation signal transduction histidine kinase